MTIDEALKILERDDDAMRRGYFCINDFTAIEKLKETVKDLNSGEAIGLSCQSPCDTCPNNGFWDKEYPS